jgi:hypothetical protein
MTTKKKAIKVTVSKKALAPVIKKITEELKGKLASKPATILYKKLPDDMILITGFENFLDIEGILDKYGRKVASTYTAYPYNMSGVDVVIFPVGLSGITSIRTGYVCNKSGFSKIVSHVKKCGGLLHDIIQAVNSGEVKRITI